MTNDIIDEIFSPLSKWVAENVFSEKQGRTLSQKVEDELGIPKEMFHAGLILTGVILLNKTGGKNKKW